ncbi:MAG TPA: SusC/RagA family TonB-linked outer membrane protein [Gemmatimonadaceae bacterium]|nr:SusC/RagA family TonB-linked outer membrane protein [Gemmatimonadaceae bacterium]
MLAATAGVAVEAAAQQATTQGGTVVGQVVNVATKTPLANVMVLVKGTELRTGTNADGRFAIRNVPAGSHTLRVQLLGYAPEEQTVNVVAGQTATLDFSMKELPYAIAPVVVTALGVERKEKSLGYAVQTISPDKLAKIPETTMMQALAGQSAGVSVTSSSGRPGAGARITIRGETSFSGNTQPLFVIDGVPVSTEMDGPSNALGTGSAGSRQMDIDMENVAELTVLRGAAATALYGSRAANGAIIIKTKQGRSGQPLTFNFNSEVRFDRPIIEGYITNWAAGSRGYFCNGKLASQGGWCEPGYPGTNPATTSNWGPNIDSIPQVVFDSLGPIRIRDARADFYKTGLTSNNSIRGSGSMGDFGTYTLGVSYLNQGGVNPVEKLDRLNMNGNVSFSLGKRLLSTTSIQRIRSENPYSDQAYDGIDHALINLPPTTDARTGYMPDGSPVMLGTSSPSIQWLIDNEYNTETTNRWVASQQFRLTVGPGIYLSNNLGLDAYVSEFGRFLNERPWRTAEGRTSGSTQQRKTTRRTINNDLQLIMDGRPLFNTGVTINGLIGGNVYTEDASYVEGRGSDIVIPGYYNLSNFATQTVRANLPTQYRLLGAYGSVTAGYGDWAFLTLTGRNDWSSTLPTNANSYFYPSASLAVVFTDALNWHPSWLDYGKIRISKAKVGNDAPAYSLSTRYVTGTLAKGANNDVQQFGGPAIEFPFRGIASFTASTQLGNPELKPESTIEDEIGLELRFFGGRARADISAYRKSSYDQIFSVPSSAVTGYNNIVRNAGDLRNKGVELSLGGRPIEMGSFSWDINVNWAKNKSKVLSLAPGVTSIGLAGYSWPQIRIMENQPYGVIWGYGWKRNCVAEDPCFENVPEGTMLIGDDGYPIRSDELRNLGTVTPNWTGSVFSDIHFKDFGLSALVDVRNGGKIINFETQYEVSNGRSILTADRYTWTVEPGVNINTGEQNTVRLFKDQDYYPKIYGFDRHENQIEPAGYTKLREITLSYRLGDAIARRLSLKGATVYVTGRNLAVWSDFSLGDPEGDVYGGNNAGGQYFRWFSAPQTRSFVVGVRSIF